MLRLALVLAAQAASNPPALPIGGASPDGEYAHFEELRMRVRVESDGRKESTEAARVLLSTTAAVTAFGQIAVPYIDGFGEVGFEDVVVQKPDGRRVEPGNLDTQDVNPFGASGLPIAADLRFRKITIPGLEPGDRLSYRIVIRERPLAPGRIFGESKFLTMLGDPQQVYELDVPRNASIVVKLREGLGAAWEEIPGSADRLVRRLNLRVPRPAQTPEGPTEEELAVATDPDVLFTNFNSWQEVGEWWWKLSKERLEPDAAVRAEAARIATAATSPQQRVEAMHAFVSSRIRYLSVGFGVGRMQPRRAGEVLSSRYGDCKDKHTLLAALGSSAGIDFRPVLIHSERRDLRDDAPGPQQFDHMISVARLGADPATWLWIDTTNPLAPAGYLLPNLRGKRAVLIEADGKGSVVRTPDEPRVAQRVAMEAKGSLSPSGELRARVAWTLRSDDEVLARLAFAASPRDQHTDIVKQRFASHWKDAEVSSISFSDPGDVSAPFRVEFDVKHGASKVRSSEDWPLWIPTPQFDLPKPRKRTDATGKAAQLVVREVDLRAEIELPEGVGARPPLSVTLDRPFGRFRSAYGVLGRTLTARRSLNILRNSVGLDEVPAYESFRKALDTDREQDFIVTPLVAATVPATAMLAEGLAAFDAKDYPRAIELLTKAAESDPKLEDVWNKVGRAHRQKGDLGAAIKAFEKQLEVNAFDETAYAERAYTFIEMGRWDYAEKDLLRQVEVAPFKPWSYGRLGVRRRDQGRHSEAAEYFGRAATLEPNEVDHWIDLAWSHLMAGGAPNEARGALRRAQDLKLHDWQQVRVGRAFRQLGDDQTAGALAETALPSLAGRLGKPESGKRDDNGPYWTARLVEAWQLVGAAALASGDLAKAERYLQASWRASVFCDAAWSLGLLAQRRGKTAEGARWLSAAASLPGAEYSLPSGFKALAEKARLAEGIADSPDLVMTARTIKLLDKPAASFNEPSIEFVVGPTGAIERVKKSLKASPEFDAVFRGFARIDLPRPDERPVWLVVNGLVACNRDTTCSFVLDLPGTK